MVIRSCLHTTVADTGLLLVLHGFRYSVDEEPLLRLRWLRPTRERHQVSVIKGGEGYLRSTNEMPLGTGG